MVNWALVPIAILEIMVLPICTSNISHSYRKGKILLITSSIDFMKIHIIILLKFEALAKTYLYTVYLKADLNYFKF